MKVLFFVAVLMSSARLTGTVMASSDAELLNFSKWSYFKQTVGLEYPDSRKGSLKAFKRKV